MYINAMTKRILTLWDGTAKNPQPLSPDELSRATWKTTGMGFDEAIPWYMLTLILAALVGVLGATLQTVSILNYGADSKIVSVVNGGQFCASVVALSAAIRGVAQWVVITRRLKKALDTRLESSFLSLFEYQTSCNLSPEVSSFFAALKPLKRDPIVAEQKWLVAEQKRYQKKVSLDRIHRVMNGADDANGGVDA